MISQVVISIVLTLFFSSFALAQLTHEQQAAKDKGLVLYNQSDWYDSQPLLRIAAEAGDRTAQYYLGEAIRLRETLKKTSRFWQNTRIPPAEFPHEADDLR